MPNPIADARNLIQSRLAELDAEAKKLKRALVSLEEGSAQKLRRGRPRRSTPVAAALPKRKRAPRKRKTAKRAPRGRRREQLLAAIKANPGARPTDLAKAIGVKPTQVHALIAKARKDKLLVKKSKGYALRS